MGNRGVSARVAVISDNDAGTISDCLDALGAQCPPDVEVVVVDHDSDDGTPDVAIRHPVPGRVVVVPAGRRQRAIDAASAEATHLLVITADSRPGPGWVIAALAGLEETALVFGPDKQCGNLALDLTQLRLVRLFPGSGEDVDEVIRRARLAGTCPRIVDEMQVQPASPSTVGGPAALPVTVPPAPDRPRYRGHVAVVLCTRDRPAHLERCLRSLAVLHDDDHEILVIDNHPEPTVDPALLPARARLVHEPRAGLDAARNRGLEETTADVIAYIDDDCEADPHWLTALRIAFADRGVGFVTGRVRPASLAEPTQRYFESHFSFDRGSSRRRFTPFDDRPWYPLWTGLIGTGCNMAFRRDALVDVGGFDVLLDVGSTIGGGGDLDVFARLLDRGVVGEYTPDALVWHHHRDTTEALRKQFRGYGEAAGAYLMKAVLDRPGVRLTAVRLFGDRIASRLRIARDIRAGNNLLPMALLVTTVVGQLSGPFRYLRARRAVRRR